MSFPRLSAKTITPAVYYNDIPVGTICCRIETKESTSHLYLLTMGEFSRVRPDCCTVHRFGADYFPEKPYQIPWHRFIYLRCHPASCRSLIQNPKSPRIYLHVQVCKPGCEAVLRTTCCISKKVAPIEGHCHKNYTERRLGTRTRYSASGERAELTVRSCR